MAVVQTNVRQSNKDSPDPADRAASFQQIIDLIEVAAREANGKPDLIICPETMVPRPIDDESVDLLPESRRYRTALEGLSAQLGIPLIVGAHAMTEWGPNPASPGYATPARRFNSAYLITPEKGVTARYDKLHRVPFGEYLPGVEGVPALKQWLLKLSPYEHDYTLSAGEKPVIFDVALPRGGRVTVGAPICFEDALGYLPRTLVWDESRKRAVLLVNLTNDGWFQGTHQAIQHEQIARFRCVENRVPMARSVNTGVSGMIDAAGRIISRVAVDGVGEGVAGVTSAALHRDERRTIYAVVGDGFAMLCLVSTLVLGGLGSRSARRSAKSDNG